MAKLIIALAAFDYALNMFRRDFMGFGLANYFRINGFLL
jgi:hypothetical protein